MLGFIVSIPHRVINLYRISIVLRVVQGRASGMYKEKLIRGDTPVNQQDKIMSTTYTLSDIMTIFNYFLEFKSHLVRYINLGSIS